MTAAAEAEASEMDHLTEQLDQLRKAVATLSDRQRRLEDVTEIRELICSYGVYADLGQHELFLGLFTDDAEIEIHGGDHSGTYGESECWSGKDELRKFITDPGVHMRIQGRSMHLPAVNIRVAVDDDHATAESSALVIVREDAAKVMYEAGFTRWSLRRVDGRWRIARRVRYGIGTPGFDAQVATR